ncbi:MAG: LegC family aminotransferase [Bacilli bacterium]
MKKNIPLSVPNISGNEIKYVEKALKEEWVSTAGPFIKEFENKIAKYVKANEAVACQNGTAGIHLSLLSVGVTSNDEVIVPALTFVATVNPVRYCNAIPVFIDCDESLCLDMGKLELFCKESCELIDNKLINKKSGNHIKAIVVVHVFGNMADMEKLMKIAKKYGLIVIEDAAEALGTYYTGGIYKGMYAGTIGDVGIYSFNGNKILTTGGGGIVVSKSKEIIEKIRHLSTQAKSDLLYFDHDEIGYNYRMTNIQAGLGLAQLERLEEFINIKRDNYNYYQAQGINLLAFRDNIRPNYWFYSFKSKDRDKAIRFLADNNVQSRPIWKLICDLKPYEKFEQYMIEQARNFWECIVNLPCSTNLCKEEIDEVVKLLKIIERA